MDPCSPLAYFLCTLTHRLLKCADDFVIGNSYSKDSDKEGLDDDRSRLAKRSAEHGLVINKTKYVECLFYSETLPLRSCSLFFTAKHTVKYLSVHFSSNMT